VFAAFVMLPAVGVAAGLALSGAAAVVFHGAAAMLIAMGIVVVAGPVVHESGHALAGVVIGERIRRFEIDHRGARVRLRADRLPGASSWWCWWPDRRPASPSAPVVLAVALGSPGEICAWAVGLGAAGNVDQSTLIPLLPVRLGRHRTDGYQVLLAARGTHPDLLAEG
jgi:hypothetical protein